MPSRSSSVSRATFLWLGLWPTLLLVVLFAGRPAGVGAAGGLAEPQAPAATVIDSDIVTDTVWTAAGSPYEVAFVSSGILVEPGVTLTVDPGVEVRFGPYASMIVKGTIRAIGTPAAPITFTGTTKTPGWWLFVEILGSFEARNQGSVFRHVTMEYAQQNLMLFLASAHLSDCTLRQSSEAGLWTAYAEGTVVERCRITDNLGYGIQNAIGRVILAASNWWGSASGPTHAACNPTGAGDVIDDTGSEGVAFRPFLTDPGQEVAPVTAGQALQLTLAPERWFAPADGATTLPVVLTLRDGEGNPLAGRTVCLYSDLGSAGGCAVTGAGGTATTVVISDTPGDATLWATVEEVGECEVVGSSEVVVTFTDGADDPLLPGSEAPYANGDIDINPKPVTLGVPSTVSVRLTNPNPYPILVDVVFSYAQFSIGTMFAPLGGVSDVRIGAGDEAVASVPWTPPESGHVCLRVAYAYQPADLAGMAVQAVSGGGQTNFSIVPPSLGDPGPDEGDPPDEEEPPEEEEEDPESKPQMAQKAKAAMDRVNDAQLLLDAVSEPANIPGMAIPNQMFSAIMDFNLESWATATQALSQDPPRQDYDVYAIPETYTFTPLVPSEDPYLSVARAKAGNLLMTSMLELLGELRAASLSLDRYTGATNAGDLHWASEQAAILLTYEQQAGATMLEAADRIDGLLDVMVAEGTKDLVLDASTVITYQTRLAKDGFNRTELSAAHAIGMTNDEIEAERLARIAADPKELAGSVMERLAGVAVRLRMLAPVMMDPPNFDEGAGGMAGASIEAPATNLTRVFVSRTAFRIGNPKAYAETVELRVRRLDMPADWMASVSPALVELEAGQVVTGTLAVRPGLPAVQGARPRVAVEGYIGEELIGGVVVEVLVPEYAIGGLVYRVYLPLVVRH